MGSVYKSFSGCTGFQGWPETSPAQAEGSVPFSGHEAMRWRNLALGGISSPSTRRRGFPSGNSRLVAALSRRPARGQFFVDAGRREFTISRLFEPDQTPEQQFDESGLRRRWNRELADGVTLPLLLPVLAEYVKSHRLTDNEIGELTKSIGDAVAGSGGASRPSVVISTSICRDVALGSTNQSRWIPLDSG